MKKNLLLPVLLLMLFSAADGQTKHVVMVSNFAFTPQDINITVGDTVEWQWVEGTHTTTSDENTGPDVWDSPISSSVPVFSVVITTDGIHGYHCIPHQSLGMIGTITASEPTGINEQNSFVSDFRLFQNYPNPFNPSTVIKYNIPAAAFVTLKVYNTLGNEVATLVNENQRSGEHSTVFDVSKINGLASGVYLYRLEAGILVKTRKMLLIK